MDEKVNIKSILEKILFKWYYFLIAILIIGPLAFLYVKTSDHKYLVRASLFLKSEKFNSPEKFMKGMDLFTGQTILEDEVGLLTAYSTIESAIHTLDFGVSYFTKGKFNSTEQYGDFAFKIDIDSNVSQIASVPIYVERISEAKYMVWASSKAAWAYNFLSNWVEPEPLVVEFQEVLDIGTPFVSKNLSFKVEFNDKYKVEPGTKQYFVINNLQNVTADYQARLNVAPISMESNIVELSIKDRIPSKEIDFLNRLLDVYLENELFKKNQLGLRTIQFIDSQLSGVSDSLRQVEGSLESFRSRNNIMDINSTAQNLTNNLDRLETQRSEIQVKLQYYQYLASTLKNVEGVNDIVAPSTYGVNDPLLSNLLIELAKLNQERSGLNYSTREGNPMSEVIDLKIRNTKRAINENVGNFIDASTIALNDINKRISQINSNLQRLPRNERELVKIQRRFDFSDNVYNYLLEKRAEAGIAIASNVVEKTVIDRAMMVGSGPVSPNSRLIYLLAIFLAFGGSLGLIIVKDFLNDNIVSHEDLQRQTRIPFLGTISHGSKSEQSPHVIANALTPVGESFRTLRVNLQYLTLGKEINVIGFTSSRESEGKTFCSVNLAAAMALARKRTVLIDADMRRPRVGSYFQLENEKGLSNYLIGECSVKDIINETGIKGFDVITSGPIPPNPIDLLSQPRMEELFTELKRMYNTVIIDSPPLGYVSEYIILMKHTDANIYIVRSDYTTRFNLEKINKLYDERKINNISILLNDVKYSRLNGYTYSYKYKKA